MNDFIVYRGPSGSSCMAIVQKRNVARLCRVARRMMAAGIPLHTVAPALAIKREYLEKRLQGWRIA